MRDATRQKKMLLPSVYCGVQSIRSGILRKQKNHLNAAEETTIMDDRDALNQVLLILLDNAIQYSVKPVEVEHELAGSCAEIRVQTYGEGLSIDNLE